MTDITLDFDNFHLLKHRLQELGTEDDFGGFIGFNERMAYFVQLLELKSEFERVVERATGTLTKWLEEYNKVWLWADSQGKLNEILEGKVSAE